MARPPLAIGTHGSMKAKYRADRKVWVAHTRFRDFDGVTRLVQRVGRSQTAALAALQGLQLRDGPARCVELTS